MHDSQRHKDRIISDYKRGLPWAEILRRNKENGLNASQRTVQYWLAKWEVLHSATNGNRVEASTARAEATLLPRPNIPDEVPQLPQQETEIMSRAISPRLMDVRSSRSRSAGPRSRTLTHQSPPHESCISHSGNTQLDPVGYGRVTERCLHLSPRRTYLRHPQADGAGVGYQQSSMTDAYSRERTMSSRYTYSGMTSPGQLSAVPTILTCRTSRSPIQPQPQLSSISPNRRPQSESFQSEGGRQQYRQPDLRSGYPGRSGSASTATSEHQPFIVNDGASQTYSETSTRSPGGHPSYEPSNPQVGRTRFEKVWSEEYRKKSLHASLRSCCPHGPDLYSCPVCFIDDIHRLAIQAPEMDIRALKAALKYRAGQINLTDAFGNAALHFLAATGKAQLPHYFVFFQHGAGIHIQNTSGKTFLHVLNPGVNYSQLPTLLAELKRKGFDMTLRDVEGRTALHCLGDYLPTNVYRSITAIFEQNGVSCDYRDSLGRGPWESHCFFLSCERRARTMVRPDPSEVPARDPTVVALTKTSVALLEEDPVASAFCRGPSMQAQLEEMNSFIVNSLDNPRLEDQNGNNGLHWLAWKSHFPHTYDQQIVLNLLRGGVDCNHFNSFGQNPLHTLSSLLASRNGTVGEGIIGYMTTFLAEVTEYPDHYHFNVNYQDQVGRTALFLACLHGQVYCVELLLSHGANPNVRDSCGESLLAACKREVAYWLRESQMPNLLDEKRTNAQFLAGKIQECISRVMRWQGVEEPDLTDEWSVWPQRKELRL